MCKAKLRFAAVQPVAWQPDPPECRARFRLAGGRTDLYFREKGLVDFLDIRFALADKLLAFSHGMLTETAIDKMQGELRQLRLTFGRLHEESLASPLAKRRGSGLLLAMREWEPAGSTQLRRQRSQKQWGSDPFF